MLNMKKILAAFKFKDFFLSCYGYKKKITIKMYSDLSVVYCVVIIVCDRDQSHDMIRFILKQSTNRINVSQRNKVKPSLYSGGF